MKKAAIHLLLFYCTSGVIYSQEKGLQNNYRRLVSIGLNSDSFAGFEAGYAQNTGFSNSKDLLIYMRFSFPILLNLKDRSFDTWQVTVGARSDILEKGNFGTIADLQLYMIQHRQILGSFLPVGARMSLTPSYKFKGGYLGFQIKWDQTVATHINNSQYVRDAFTEIPVSVNVHLQDGWYGSTGSSLGFGIEGAKDLSSRISFYGDIGIKRFHSSYTRMFDAMMMGQVPFYGNLRFSYTF